MAIHMLSPGVYPVEVDKSQYTNSDSTCIIGLVGGAVKGPVNKPILITSQSELIETFGKPSDKEFGIASAFQILSQSNQVYYCRVTAKPQYQHSLDDGTKKVVFKAKNPNKYKVVIESASDKGKITITNIDTSENLEYDNLNLEDPKNERYFVKVLEVENAPVSAEVEGTPVSSDLVGEYELSGEIIKGPSNAVGNNKFFNIESRYPDSSINGAKLIFSKLDKNNYFYVTLVDEGEVLEAITDLSLDVSDVNNYFLDKINKKSQFIKISLVKENLKIKTEEFNKLDSIVISNGDDSIDEIRDSDIIEGFAKFSNPETLDLDFLSAPGYSSIAVINEGIRVCKGRGESVYIADIPFGMSVKEVTDFVNTTSTENGVLQLDNSFGYVAAPWGAHYDTFKKSYKWLPPSVMVLTTAARNDKSYYPWSALAGPERGRVDDFVALEYYATKDERDKMYGNRNVINPIINYRNQGITIFGQKTLQRRASALDRLNVRRLMNYIIKNVNAISQKYVFEDNIKYTWDRWIDEVSSFLENVKTKRGVTDYQVTMNPTANEIENNQMPGTVAVKPTKVAEFIPIYYNIVNQTVKFSEDSSNII